MLGYIFFALYLGGIGLVLAIFLAGDPESKSPLGRITYATTVWLPVKMETVLLKLPCGQRMVNLTSGTVNYVCYQKNPLLQIVYLVMRAHRAGPTPPTRHDTAHDAAQAR